MCRCDIFCATDPTNSTDIVGEWGTDFITSLPLRDIYKPTPTFLRQRSILFYVITMIKFITTPSTLEIFVSSLLKILL
jgi:hypothetical protein